MQDYRALLIHVIDQYSLADRFRELALYQMLAATGKLSLLAQSCNVRYLPS